MKNILSVSNIIADYPPYNLSIHEWQGLMVLSAIINSKEKLIIGLKDIQDEIEKRGVKKEEEQEELLRIMIWEKDTYRMDIDEFFSYYKGDTPLNRQTKLDIIAAIKSLNEKKLKTNNPNPKSIYASFSWFDSIVITNQEIQYTIGRASRMLLKGLDANFFQVMARLSKRKAKKYDYPIFIHAKSRLHSKKRRHKFIEPLDEWKIRFNHHKIPSYDNWKDYYRRVLKPSEEYSKSSGDIQYKFTGIAVKGRKITHVKCEIWRIGNIHEETGELNYSLKKRNERTKREQILSFWRKKAFDFLAVKGVNKSVLLNEVLFHNCLDNESVKGFEDLFFEFLWKLFIKYTKAQKPAGAFVSWWRKGKLTEDSDHYWKVVDLLVVKKVDISGAERKERRNYADMAGDAYIEAMKQQEIDGEIVTKKEEETTNGMPTHTSNDLLITEKDLPKSGFHSTASILPKIPKILEKPFLFEEFREKYYKQYATIQLGLYEKVARKFEGDKGSDIDMEKEKVIAKEINKMLPEHCEFWYKKNVLNE